MNRHVKLSFILVIAVLLYIGVFVLDYYDVFSNIGLNVTSINLQAESIILSAIVAIILFLSAYYLVDRWSRKQYENKRETALRLMTNTYQECKRCTESLDDSIEGDILIEVKRGNVDYQGEGIKYFSEYEKIPFQTHDYIMQFCTDGIVEATEIIEYLEIMNLYKGYIMVFTLFGDKDNRIDYVMAKKKELLTKVDAAINKKKG